MNISQTYESKILKRRNMSAVLYTWHIVREIHKKLN